MIGRAPLPVCKQLCLRAYRYRQGMRTPRNEAMAMAMMDRSSPALGDMAKPPDRHPTARSRRTWRAMVSRSAAPGSHPSDMRPMRAAGKIWSIILVRPRACPYRVAKATLFEFRPDGRIIAPSGRCASLNAARQPDRTMALPENANAIDTALAAYLFTISGTTRRTADQAGCGCAAFSEIDLARSSVASPAAATARGALLTDRPSSSE